MEIRLSKNVFNPTFLPLLDNNKDFVILLIGGGGSGKSYFSFQRCIYRCLLDKRKYLVVRNSAVDLKRSCWEDVLSALEFFKIRSKVVVNYSDKKITFPNGSSILFMGLDDDSKVKSIPNITDIIVEECSEITLDKFSQLKQRLRGNGKLKNQIVLQCNPVSKVNWVYSHFFANGCKEADCLIHKSTYKDNRFINETTVKALEGYKDTNDLYYRVYCLGEFGSLAKLVFSNWEIKDFDYQKIKGELLVGLDFGFITSLTTVVSSILVEREKTIYIFDEFGKTNLTNDEIAQVIKDKGLAKEVIIADSAEPKSITEIRKLGIPQIKGSAKGADSVIHGIQQLQQYKLVVHPSCKGFIEDFSNYCWKKDKATNEYYNVPDKDAYDAHYIDALRYSLQCSSAKLKTLSKTQLF